MSRKWFIVGGAFGLVVPLLFRVYEILQFGHVLPVVFCMFWPTSFVAGLNYPPAPWMRALAILANMAVFGALAGILRRSFLVALFVLLLVAWVLLPPSKAVLARRFQQQQATMQQLAEMSKADPQNYQNRFRSV